MPWRRINYAANQPTHKRKRNGKIMKLDNDARRVGSAMMFILPESKPGREPGERRPAAFVPTTYGKYIQCVLLVTLPWAVRWW